MDVAEIDSSGAIPAAANDTHWRWGIRLGAGLLVVTSSALVAEMLALWRYGSARILIVLAEAPIAQIALAIMAFLAACRWADESTGGMPWGLQSVRTRTAALLAIALFNSHMLVVGITASEPYLAGLTWRACDVVVRAMYIDVVNRFADRTLGTPVFSVHLGRGCTGIEGLILGVSLVAPYLWVARSRLRFPRSLVHFPIVAAAVLIANVARISLLIAVGHHDAALAMGGFHSGAGWFLFATALLVTIPATERLLHLRVEADAPTDGSHETRQLLLPFVASLAASLLVTMSGLGGTPWALLRYAAAVLAMVVVGPPSGLTSARSVSPWIAGAILTVPWWIFSVSGGETSAPSIWHALGYILVTPVIEEFAFRGYLLRRFAGDASPSAAIGWAPLVVSSALFGVMHTNTNLGAVSGMVFGLAARRWGLGGAVAAHVATNAALAAVGVFA